MEFRKGDIPSMDNIYNSTQWEKNKNKEVKINKNSQLSNIKLDNMYNNFYTDINEYFTSLTGEKIDKANLTHNNMQKYIKGNVTQNTNLDNYIIDSNKDVNKLYNNKIYYFYLDI